VSIADDKSESGIGSTRGDDRDKDRDNDSSNNSGNNSSNGNSNKPENYTGRFDDLESQYSHEFGSTIAGEQSDAQDAPDNDNFREGMERERDNHILDGQTVPDELKSRIDQYNDVSQTHGFINAISNFANFLGPIGALAGYGAKSYGKRDQYEGETDSDYEARMSGYADNLGAIDTVVGTAAELKGYGTPADLLSAAANPMLGPGPIEGGTPVSNNALSDGLLSPQSNPSQASTAPTQETHNKAIQAFVSLYNTPQDSQEGYITPSGFASNY